MSVAAEPRHTEQAKRYTARMKKAEIIAYVARLLAEKAHAEEQCREYAGNLTEAREKLDELTRIDTAIQAIAKHKNGSTEDIYAALLENAGDMAKAVEGAEWRDDHIEWLEEDRARLLRALGVRECDWQWRAHLY